MSKQYSMNRLMGRPIEFQGFRGQYILYAGFALVGDLVLFVILYLTKLSPVICILICFGGGFLSITLLYKRSNRYGIHGWAKRRAAKRIPPFLRHQTRTTFINLKKRP